MPNDLPEPDSNELADLGLDPAHRLIYNYLWRRRENPPTMIEIAKFVAEAAGEDQSQTGRRVRDLYERFDIQKVSRGKRPRYTLVALLEAPRQPRTAISERVRAVVLSPKRCAQCGRTPTEDGVKLEVDHIIPMTWGGTNNLSNLQPLCEACNRGKKDLYSDFDPDADRIKRAATLSEPHKRIGETLLAFYPEPTPADVIAVVASALSYQDDWQKRLRELRSIGWDYSVKREKIFGRIKSFYTLTRWEPWPNGPVRRAIDEAEKKAKQAKLAGAAKVTA